MKFQSPPKVKAPSNNLAKRPVINAPPKGSLKGNPWGKATLAAKKSNLASYKAKNTTNPERKAKLLGRADQFKERGQKFMNRVPRADLFKGAK